jgi:hypothetical protein
MCVIFLGVLGEQGEQHQYQHEVRNAVDQERAHELQAV